MSLRIEKLNAFYGKKQVLENITLHAESGKITALIGRNGSGKSTLAGCLNGSVKYSGNIKMEGESLSGMKRREAAKLIAVMPQLLTAPHITVKELVAFGRNPYLSPGEKLKEKDIKAIGTAIKNADLSAIQDCFADRISGGELRRAYLGMILAQDTPVIVLDEATAYMDADNEGKFLSLISQLKNRQNKTVLCVMHSLTNAVRYADSIAVMDKGRIIYQSSTPEILKTDIIEKNFGIKRFEADNRIFFGTE